MHLLAHEGLTSGILRAFVIYLICCNRPFHEILFPALRDISYDFGHHAFAGMGIGAPVEIGALLSAREQMIREVQEGLTKKQRQFILTFTAAEPDWDLLDITHAEELPGVKWRLLNLQRLRTETPGKFEQQATALNAYCLGG